MASIENRSHYQVSVKNRDDLTKTFPHDKQKNAEAYCQSLRVQKFKPKLILLDDHYMVRIRKKGHEDQVLYANSLKEAELVRAKLKVEHSQGLFVDYSKAQNTTLAELMIRYLREEAPRNKSFEIDAYKINAMLEDAGLQRQSIAEIVASHPNPCAKVKAMKIRKESGKKMRPAACSATRFILKPFAQIVPDDLTEYVDERCQAVSKSTVDRELDIISAVCNIAIKTWRIHLLVSPMDGVKRPKYFNERDRRLKADEEGRLLEGAFVEDQKWSQAFRLDQLVSPELQQAEGSPTRYRIWQTRKRHLSEAQATWIHIPMFETFIQFQLMSGARRGESLSLLWSNVDLEAQTAFLLETKNGRPRKLPLRSDLVELLRQLPHTGELVFGFTNEALRKAWGRMCDHAGFTDDDDLHVHDLRHEAISRVAEIGSNTPGGFSLLDLQAFSGHRDVRMLLRYEPRLHACGSTLLCTASVEGCRYTLKLSRGPRFLEVPAAPGFPLQPSCVTACSSAYVCSTGCALAVRPLSRTFTDFHSITGHQAIACLAPFPCRPTSAGRTGEIGSKEGITPSSALRSRTSPIRGMRLQRLLGFRLATWNLSEWRSDVPFRAYVFLQSGGPLAKPSLSLKTHRADHHAYDFFSAFAEALALKIHLSYQGIA